MATKVRLVLLLAVLALSLFAGSLTVLADSLHVVRAGETLSSIGRIYGVNPYTIAAVNGLANPNFIVVGQRLAIPSVGTTAGTAVSPPPAPGRLWHMVAWGETLSGIGRRYGVSVQALADANGLRNWNYIRRGQVLVIPSGRDSKPFERMWPAPTVAPLPADGRAIWEVREPVIEATAWVSSQNPERYGSVTVYGRLTSNGVGVPGVPMHAEWRYKTTSSYCDGTTGGDGVASCTRRIATATLGFYVTIEVQFVHVGRTYFASTGFSPH